MGLSTKEAGGSSMSGGIKITDGVFANLKTIQKVRDLSGKKIEFINNLAFDIALEVEFEGDKFPQLFFGNLKTDASGEVIDWGGAFIVALLFENAHVSAELNDKNRFESDDLRELIGKQVYTVSYTNGTYKKEDGTKGTSYRNWNMTFDADEDPEDLQVAILDAWEKSRQKGYPKDYEYPGQSGGGKLSTGSKSKAKKAGVTESIDLSDVDDMDDDLPF